MRLIAIKDHHYPPNTLVKSGQEYEATVGDAVVLVGAKLSTYVEQRGDSPVRDALEEIATYETKEQTPVSEEKPKRKKRQYKRKDMNPATA